MGKIFGYAIRSRAPESIWESVKRSAGSCWTDAAQAATAISAIGLPVTSGTILAWERGAGVTAREPFASDLPVLASVYGCSIGELLQEMEDRKPPETRP